MPVIQRTRPLLATWAATGTQLSFERGVLKVGFPPSEAHARDSLMRDTTRKFLIDLLADLAGQPLRLDLVVDETLKAAPQPEFFLGAEPEAASKAPEPPKAAAPAPAAPPPPAAAPAVDDSFYQDPLIQKAMEIFKAKLVSAPQG